MFGGWNAFATAGLKELLSVLNFSVLNTMTPTEMVCPGGKTTQVIHHIFNRLDFKDGNAVEALSHSSKGSY